MFNAMTTPGNDIANLERRCPRLGGQVAFSYCCMAADNRRPCFKVFDCWWERFDVVAYFKQRLSENEFAELIGTPPPDKTATLVDLIRQAQQRSKS